MKFYKKYLLVFSIALLVGLSIHLLLFCLNLGHSQAEHNGNDWFNVKDSYAKSITQPKLVFISGSNTLFGVDTAKIEKALNIPTVNYGVVANYNFYTLHRAKPHLKSGDIVILPLEYTCFYDYKPTRVDTGFAQYITGYDTDFFKNLPISEQLSIICQLTPRELMKSTWQQIKPPTIDENDGYSSKHLNTNGDMTNNPVDKRTSSKILLSKLKDSPFKSQPPTKEAQTELTKFINFCHENNIKIYAAWPNFLWKAKEFTGKDLDGIRAIEDFYHTHNVEILGEYTDCLYDADLFYDTEYHLNEEGKRIHTDYLINLLKNKLSQL